MIKSERTAKLAEQCNNLLLKSENYNRRHIIAKRIVLGFFCLFFFCTLLLYNRICVYNPRCVANGGRGTKCLQNARPD